MKVNAEQHVSGMLTSKQSPSGTAGYQTLSHTRGLTQDEVRIIESLAQDASAREGKVKWQSYRLHSSRHVICRVVPIPEPDEFGRRGRFFTHSLIFNIDNEQQFDEALCDLLRPRNFFLSLEQILTSDTLKTGHLPPVALEVNGEWINEADALIRGWSGEQLHRLFLLTGDPRRLIETGEHVALVGSEEQILDALKVAFLLTPVAARRFCAFDTNAAIGTLPSKIIFWGRGGSAAGETGYVLDAARRHVTIPESSPLLAAGFPLEQLSTPLREAVRTRFEEPAEQQLSTLLDRQYAAFVGRPIYQTLVREPELELTAADLELLTPLGQQYLSLGLLLALKTGNESERLKLLAAMDLRSYGACLDELRNWRGFRPWQVFSPPFMSLWFEFFRDSYSLDDLTAAVGAVAEHGSKQDRKSLEAVHEYLDPEQRQALGRWLKTTANRFGKLQAALDKPVNAETSEGKPNSLWHRMLHPFSK